MPPQHATTDHTGRALRDLLIVAGPTVATMVSYTLMQFIDALMVSRIGPEAVYVAAQGNGGMAVWLPVSMMIALVGVVNTYVSQNLGAGRPERTGRYGWAGLWLCAGYTLFLLPYALLIPAIFGLMGHGEDLYRMETSYGQVLIFSAILTMATRALSQFFFGLHRPWTVLAAAIIGNLVNVLANAVLIFGADGPPAGFPGRELVASLAGALGVEPMGVVGAAWGTVIGSAAELVVPLAVFLSPRYARGYGTRNWRPSWVTIRDILRIGWPGGLMFVNEMTCWFIFMVYLTGQFGAEHNSAGWIVLRYMHMSFMPAMGLSFAVTAAVGKSMGMKRPDLAAKRTWLGAGVTCAYMGACGVAFVLFRHDMIALFIPHDADPKTAEALVAIGSRIMIAAAIFQMFDALGVTLTGALRGAGDTVWPGLVTIVLSWVFLVAGAWGMTKVAPGLTSLGPWLAATGYFLVLGVAMGARFAGGKWRTMSLIKHEAGPPMAGGSNEGAPIPAPAPSEVGARDEAAV